jgi:hypothetical protein
MTPLLEVSPKGTHVRLRQAWPEWVLPNATVNEDVKNEFEEAEKNKSTSTEQDEKKDETATAVDEKKPEEEEEAKAEASTTESSEEIAKPVTPDSDSISIRSPTLKSQCTSLVSYFLHSAR